MDRALFERPERTSHISGYAGHRPSHPVFETFGGSGETRAIGTLPESPGPLQPSYNDRIAAPAAKPLNPPPAAAGLAEISCDSSEDGGSDAGYRGFQLGGASSNAGGSSFAMQRRMKQLMASRRSSEVCRSFARVRWCVRACACVRVCVRACVRACVCVCDLHIVCVCVCDCV